ncbi:hypothetical protein MKW92_043228 [Papaver armeniacum]|nr:hypothetical protein MKW92_043228 [Papaver armeniacum]
MGLCNSTIGDSERVNRWRFNRHCCSQRLQIKGFPFLITQFSFPNQVFELEASVRTLDLTNNKIADNHIERLPVNLGKLESLKMLTLDRNRLTSFPDELGFLRKLEQLAVSRNLLTSLPETIGRLRYYKDYYTNGLNYFHLVVIFWKFFNFLLYLFFSEV